MVKKEEISVQLREPCDKKEEIAVQLREPYGKKRRNCCRAKTALW
jgi:hypothetical protein